MIYYFDSELQFLGIEDEVSFSYSKKANLEGSGKVSVLTLPPKEALYIIIYAVDKIVGKNEYITSGYISEFIEERTGYAFQFKTFEGLLKNHFIPKKWACYNKLTLSQIVADLLFGFRPIYKTSKANLGVLDASNPTVLYCSNIAFNEIEGADLTLAFDPSEQQENNYRYCTDGYVIFQYDLGKPDFVKINNSPNSENIPQYPVRVLRWSEQVGEKVGIYWQAIESDSPADLTKVMSEVSQAPRLEVRKDIKTASLEEGVLLPNTKRYLVLMLSMYYIKPDYVNDYNTQEIKVGEKTVIRTVRGFTPILHGFEILNRCALSPFSLSNNIPRPILEVRGSFDKYINTDDVKLEGSSFADALSTLQKEQKFNLAFDIRLSTSGRSAFFYISMFSDEAVGKSTYYGRDLRFTKDALLKSEEENLPFYANFSLHTMRRKQELPILLDVKGEGTEIDALRFAFYIHYVSKGDAYVREVFVYGADGINMSEFNSILQVTPVTKGFIDNVQAKPYIEEHIEANNAKTIKDIAAVVLKHLKDKEKKEEEEISEAVVSQDVRLYDYVRLVHPKSQKVYDVFLKEEKIALKDGKLTKTAGLQGNIYNPFDCLFDKKKSLPIVTIPTMPIDVKAISHQNRLRVEWTAQGAYQGFFVKISRRDGVRETGFETNEWIRSDALSGYIDLNELQNVNSWKTLSTENSFIEFRMLECDRIYSVSVASYYERKNSKWTAPLYIKMQATDNTLRHLSSLSEPGEEGEEAYFFNTIYEDACIYNGGVPAKFFNDITQVETMNLTSSELGLIVTETKDNISYCYRYRHIRRMNKDYSPEYRSWDSSKYEKVLCYFGKYYVYRNGEWGVRDVVVPSAPLLFLDFNMAGVSKSPILKDFAPSWHYWVESRREFRAFKHILERLALYNPSYTYLREREFDPKYPTYADVIYDRDWWEDNKYFGAEYSSGDYRVTELIRPVQNQFHPIDDYFNSTRGQNLTIRAMMKQRYLSVMLADISGKNHHLKFKVFGFRPLTKVHTKAKVEIDGVIREKKYYLNNAFRFDYCDMDNGGVTTIGGEAADIRFKVRGEENNDFDRYWEVPYQVDSIPFLKSLGVKTKSGKANVTNATRKKLFTFSCWLRVTDLKMYDTYVWDVQGICVGYVDNGYLRIGHRSVAVGKGEGDWNKIIHPPVFMPYSWSIKELQDCVNMEREDDIYKSNFFHVMVECTVDKTLKVEQINEPEWWDKSGWDNFETNFPEFEIVRSWDIRQTVYINFRKEAEYNFPHLKIGQIEPDPQDAYKEIKYWEPDTYVEGNDRRLLKLMRKFWDDQLLDNLPSLRIATYDRKPRSKYKLNPIAGEYIMYCTPQADQTDYLWHQYRFDIAHVMIFEGFLTREEKSYLREFGVYPRQTLPNWHSGYQEPTEEDEQNTGEGGHKPKGYLGIAQGEFNWQNANVKTTKSGGNVLKAKEDETILISKTLPHFKKGYLYQWRGDHWEILYPISSYQTEYLRAIDDIQYLACIKEEDKIIAFEAGIGSSVLSNNVTCKSLIVADDKDGGELQLPARVLLDKLPTEDPKTDGVLWINDEGFLKLSCWQK